MVCLQDGTLRNRIGKWSLRHWMGLGGAGLGSELGAQGCQGTRTLAFRVKELGSAVDLLRKLGL